MPPQGKSSRSKLEKKTEPESSDRSSGQIKIGTSGWSYKEWEGIFYPDAKTPKLKYYSGIFGTAEIDSTFYANPPRGLAYGWVKNTPEKFEFSVKLPKAITHEKQLDLSAGAEIDLLNFLELLGPLKDSGKLGPLLIQLPPSFGLEKRSLLEEFFKALPREYTFAAEFRNRTWLKDPDLHSLLRKHGVASTIVDEPLMPVDLAATSDIAFVRWHGRGKRPWYDYLYSPEELDPWVEKVTTLTSKVKKIYGYFNNHFHGNAVENGLEFLEKLGRASEVQEKTLEEIRERRSNASQATLAEF